MNNNEIKNISLENNIQITSINNSNIIPSDNNGRISPLIFNSDRKITPYNISKPFKRNPFIECKSIDPFKYTSKYFFNNSNESIIESKFELPSYEYKIPSYGDAEKINDAYNTLRKSDINWKRSVQQFRITRVQQITSLVEDINNDKYKPSKPNEFITIERGRTRYIKANSIRDKVIQKSFCKNVLIPALQSKLIYDNGASIKNKGISFARKRFENHLRSAYKEYND